jgi:hypothetical protein
MTDLLSPSRDSLNFQFHLDFTEAGGLLRSRPRLTLKISAEMTKPFEIPTTRLRTNAERRTLNSVFRLRINSLQRLSHILDEAHHGATLEFGLRRRVCPYLFWFMNRDVIPHDARAIMLSHSLGEGSVSVPVLLDSRIVNSPKSKCRRCAQVCSQYRLPYYEYPQTRVCLCFQ